MTNKLSEIVLNASNSVAFNTLGSFRAIDNFAMLGFVVTVAAAFAGTLLATILVGGSLVDLWKFVRNHKFGMLLVLRYPRMWILPRAVSYSKEWDRKLKHAMRHEYVFHTFFEDWAILGDRLPWTDDITDRKMRIDAKLGPATATTLAGERPGRITAILLWRQYKQDLKKHEARHGKLGGRLHEDFGG